MTLVAPHGLVFSTVPFPALVHMTSVSTSLPVTYPPVFRFVQCLFCLSSPLNIFKDYCSIQRHRLGGPQDSICPERAGVYFLFYLYPFPFSHLFRPSIVTSPCAQAPLYKLSKLFLRHKSIVIITTVTTCQHQSKPVTWSAGGAYL